MLRLDPTIATHPVYEGDEAPERFLRLLLAAPPGCLVKFGVTQGDADARIGVVVVDGDAIGLDLAQCTELIVCAALATREDANFLENSVVQGLGKIRKILAGATDDVQVSVSDRHELQTISGPAAPGLFLCSLRQQHGSFELGFIASRRVEDNVRVVIVEFGAHNIMLELDQCEILIEEMDAVSRERPEMCNESTAAIADNLRRSWQIAKDDAA